MVVAAMVVVVTGAVVVVVAAMVVVVTGAVVVVVAAMVVVVRSISQAVPVKPGGQASTVVVVTG